MIKRSSKIGFTLTELMITAMIIGILATIGVISYTGYLRRSRSEQNKALANEILQAIESYKITYRKAPADINSGPGSFYNSLSPTIQDRIVTGIGVIPSANNPKKLRIYFCNDATDTDIITGYKIDYWDPVDSAIKTTTSGETDGSDVICY